MQNNNSRRYQILKAYSDSWALEDSPIEDIEMLPSNWKRLKVTLSKEWTKHILE